MNELRERAKRLKLAAAEQVFGLFRFEPLIVMNRHGWHSKHWKNQRLIL